MQNANINKTMDLLLEKIYQLTSNRKGLENRLQKMVDQYASFEKYHSEMVRIEHEVDQINDKIGNLKDKLKELLQIQSDQQKIVQDRKAFSLKLLTYASFEFVYREDMDALEEFFISHHILTREEVLNCLSS